MRVRELSVLVALASSSFGCADLCDYVPCGAQGGAGAGGAGGVGGDGGKAGNGGAPTGGAPSTGGGGYPFTTLGLA